MLKRITLLIAAFALVIVAAVSVYVATTPRLAPTQTEASGLAAPSAQTSTNDGGISVSGAGKVNVKPNVALASIGVEITAPTLAEATSQANTKSNALIEKIKSMGVADKDIQTINYSIQPITQQPRAGSSPTISGYRINNQLRVTIRKIDDAGKILDAAVAAGANNIYGVSFTIDDATPYQQQARVAAIKDAQDKAGQLAKAANITLGKILMISEGGAAPRPVFRTTASFAAEAASVPLETGELEISVTVDVRFALP
ncbi:26 kDa periplasmic immunogenic protein [Anaerolineae bacterium]|nr:26 kDa periplasmic immunogenic protein [Anaerolineae bacterium]